MRRPYPAYKDSLFNWLGKIPAHWEEERAKWYFDKIDERSKTGEEELLSVSHITGVTPRSEKNVTMFQAESYEGHKLCQPGDLVINSMWAWMAALGVSKNAGIVSSAYGVYRPKTKDLFNPQYLDYLMRIKGYAGEYLCRSKGIWSSRLLLNPDAFFNIPIVHPPIEDQNAIVAFLEEQTAVINQFLTNKRRLIELLEEQKQVVINTAVMQGLDTAVPRKPSGIDWLGDIPAHWETNRVKFVSKKITDCKNRTPPYFDDGEYFVVRTSNVRNGQLDMTEALFTNEEGFTEWTRRGVPKVGSVLFTREAPAGEACMIPPNLNLCLGQRMMSIEPNEDKLLPRFLLYQIYSDLIKNYITLASAGSTVTHLRVGQVFSLPVLLPPIEEQNRIVEYIDVKMAEINTAIERTQSEIELIEEYRTTLIAHTVTGKIDVRLNNPK